MDSQPEIKQLTLGLKRVFKGEDLFLDRMVSCLLAGGHLLLEDLPGTGKTTLARTAASLISDIRFSRVQFTPDLLPFDITGVEIWDSRKEQFEFRRGPVFTHVLLADEINRTTPKVQSALLEAMAESQVTVAGKTYFLDAPFFVIATQNPVEMEGTYPLPAAQLDRFMMKLHPGYPTLDQEYEIVASDPSRRVLPFMKPVISREQMLQWQRDVLEIHCDETLVHKAVDCAVLLRQNSRVELGISTRAALMLVQAGRAYAMVQGRDYVEDQDLMDLAAPVYAHRLVLKDRSQNSDALVNDIMGELLES